MSGVNLIPVHVRAARARRGRLHGWGMIITAYSVLLVSSCVLAVASDRPTADATDKLAKLEPQNEQLKKTLDAARGELAAENRKYAAAEEVAVHPNWSQLLKLIASKRGSGVVLDSLTLAPVAAASASQTTPVKGNAAKEKGASVRPSEYLLTVTGVGRTQEDVSGFTLALEDAGIFSRVTLAECARRENAGGDKDAKPVFGFTLRCELTDSSRSHQ